MPDDALTPVLSGPSAAVATAAPVRFVAYYRVSTERQGRSGAKQVTRFSAVAKSTVSPAV